MNPLSTKLIKYLLMALMAINIIGVAIYIGLRFHISDIRPKPALTVGTSFPAFTGIDVDGDYWVPSAARCRLIRVTDDDCSFCESDQPAYQSLVNAAAAESCEIIEIGPRATGIGRKPAHGVTQLKMVNADIGSVLFPFATPQTIIVDENWVVRLTRRGTLDKRSIRNGLKVLATLEPTETTHVSDL
jgi:hypothetical protein